MNHESPYDQFADDAADEDLRQRRADEADEAENEYRQLGPLYWAALDLEDRDAAYEPGDPKRSDFLDGEG